VLSAQFDAINAPGYLRQAIANCLQSPKNMTPQTRNTLWQLTRYLGGQRLVQLLLAGLVLLVMWLFLNPS
jgi:hypothetical protein